MKYFRNILVIQDANNEVGKSIEVAAHLQRKMGSRVSVVDVTNNEDGGEESIDYLRDSLNSVVDNSSLDADLTRVSILCGRPISVLIDEVIDASHDLVLKDAHSNSEGLFLGALDLRLLQISPSTVWLVDPNSAVRPKSVMVAVSPNSDDHDLNCQLLSTASMLSEIDAVEVYVVCSGDVGEGDVYEEEMLFDHLDRLLADNGLRLPAERIIVENGLASDSILQACFDIQPDVLLMGTVVLRDVPGLWLGGTADAVARQIQSSLIGVKPADFSPILPESLTRLR